MDLRWIPGAAATPEERSAVDEAFGDALAPTPATGPDRGVRVAREGGADPGNRHLLLPAFHAVVRRAGWISPGAMNYVCQRLGVPPAEAYGVATFYSMLSTEPRPPVAVHICDDIACRVAGGSELVAELERQWGAEGQPAAGGSFVWHRSPCLGQCERPPAAFLQLAGASGNEREVAPASFDEILAASRHEVPRSGALSAPQTQRPGRETLRLLRRVGRVDPESLDDYRAHGGYAALRRAIEMGPEAVLREVTDSKLVGRGGAAFPTGRKWEAVARAPVRPHYFVCNADESEPGTFKDRVLLEEDPFAVVEAMTIAGFATGSESGFIYVRGEYPLAAARVAGAIAQARSRGFLGADVLGHGVRFDIELRRGAGAYICGEETALFNSIEGLRGEPRNKPPFPTQEGLFRKPTGVNNVETLVNVLDIVLQGGQAFAATGSGSSTGTKLFCVSGQVKERGVYEVPFGATLRQLVDMAGGLLPGRRLQTVLLGGAAGVFLAPEEMDMPLTFEAARSAGATLGSGAVLVFDDTADIQDLVIRIAAFFRDESCGQCVPCRVGTVRQEEALRRLEAGAPNGSPAAAAELSLVAEIGQVMRDASICGLGHTASSAVESAIRKLGLFGGRKAK